MSYNFDGVDDRISFASSPPSFPTAFTIVAWIKADAFPQRGLVFGAYNSSSGNLIGLSAMSAGTSGAFELEASFSGAFARWKAPDNDLATGQWYGIAGALDASSTANDATLYRKIGPSGSIASRTVTELTAPSGSLVTNQDGWWTGAVLSSYPFDGRVAYVRFYNRVLSQSEINSEFTTPGSVTSGLLLAWNFQSNANDSSGNNRNGTVSGAVLDSDNPALSGVVNTLFQRRMRRFFTGV